MKNVVVNARVLQSPITGVQRYTNELLHRWKHVRIVCPGGALRGMAAHAWEQAILPMYTGKEVLFSPSNTGPIAVSKQVVTIHDMSVFDFPEAFSRYFRHWYQFLLPKLVRCVARVITDSEFSKERIMVHTRIPAEKIDVVAPGVATHFSPVAAFPLNPAVEALRLPSSRYVLALGSREPRKNLPRLLDAWRIVEERVPEDIWLIVTGMSGESRIFSEVSVKRPPARVFFTGHVPDDVLPGLYAGAVGMVYVSLYEGFGLPPLEAMASGTPVVVGNCASLPEVVGDVGILVDPFSVQEIGASIVKLVDGSISQNRRDRGITRAKQFSWEHTADRVWRILEAC